ncbi:hypothetical protein [Hymenobacter sp. BT730]|uniref:hypothetical protein n=1 Tax=Hymenobacter sp. BT730 TaxID=3063332 RepID=UPI0026E00571|nr:hypothetical protein [Hymenobacter sp. BT730]
MVALGITRFARLEADQAVNRLLIGHLYQEASPELPLEIRAFVSLPEARQWAGDELPD